MKVLIACEESQTVCKAFRELGHEAYSCDLQDCSGGHPEWHIQCDALQLLKMRWDLIIAHPPCTYLTVTGNKYFNEEKYGQKALERKSKRKEAVEFFMQFIDADCPRIAVENPIGFMSTHYRKPDQIIQPYMFALSDEEKTLKSTCLWLKGLSLLTPICVEKPEIDFHEWITPDGRKKRMTQWFYQTRCLPPHERAKAASKTFPGIARAMAIQWGK